MLRLDLELFQLAERAQAHVQDGFGLNVGQREGLDQRLLRLVLLPDDADHLVQVQIGDQVAAQHFQPVIDLAETVARAPFQNLDPVRQESLENFPQVHDARDVVLVQHVHVEAEADLQIGGLEQRFHQHVGIDVAVLRHQDEADILRRFVAHVVQQEELAGGQKLGDLFDQAALLDLIGDLGDDDLPRALPQLLHLPPCPQAEAAAPGAVGLRDAGARFDQGAAGREVGSGDEADEVVSASRPDA